MMDTKQHYKDYSGLDAFRIFATFLVIAIHTPPLTAINNQANFFLTEVLARLAVPFFFMVTGQFILSDLLFDKSGIEKKKATKLWNYLRKTASLYVVTILIYLPVGIYTERYNELNPRSVFQMLIFKGTFYHLWYFPACITGILIIYLLHHILSIRGMLAFTVLLYLIGLVGDSYYGLVMDNPMISDVYKLGFQFFSNTRNGLFMAPVFLLMGSMIGNWKKLLHPVVSSVGFVISFLFLTAEAFTLKDFELPHRDNMYLFLLPCLFFLYQLLLMWKIHLKSGRQLRTLSSWIYILHPAMIVLVHTAAQFSNIAAILAENSILRYLTVCFLSIIASWLITWLIKKRGGPQ